jgi:TRAP-type C4-dicarboxylate transport system substrate-binding protein
VPPHHTIVKDMIEPWAAAVEEATEGRVKVEILPKALGNPPSHFDLAKDGVADITYSVHGYKPGRFLLTQAAEMPFLGNSAEAISTAYWRIHEKYLAQADEHKGVKLLGLFTHGPGHIFNAKHPVNKVEDLEGLKIRVGGGVVNEVAKSLGVTPLLKPSTKTFELMSNGVADGVFFPKETVASFKLTKLVKYGTLVPKGLYNISFFFVMNQKKFDRLDPADQEAVMSVSGEHFSRMAGRAWDNADKVGAEKMAEDGVEVIEAPAELVETIKAKTAHIEAAFVEAAEKKGVDGAAVMQALREEIAELEK